MKNLHNRLGCLSLCITWASVAAEMTPHTLLSDYAKTYDKGTALRINQIASLPFDQGCKSIANLREKNRANLIEASKDIPELCARAGHAMLPQDVTHHIAQQAVAELQLPIKTFGQTKKIPNTHGNIPFTFDPCNKGRFAQKKVPSVRGGLRG